MQDTRLMLGWVLDAHGLPQYTGAVPPFCEAIEGET